jgi:hypothetical protein
METLLINGTGKTPIIKMDAKSGLIEMTGSVIPEDAVKFFEPMLNWLDQYVKKPNHRTKVNINLDYFNTSSSRQLLNIIRKLEPIIKEHNAIVNVNWYYLEEDEDMLKAGEEYASLTVVPFNMVQIEE